MKLRERYRQLQDPAVVKAMVVRSVYASMALEDQTVPMARLEAKGPYAPNGRSCALINTCSGPRSKASTR